MAEPRIAPRPMSELRDDWVATLEHIPGTGLKGPLFPKNVLGVLMQSPEVFGPFLRYWVASKLEMGLSVREQELVILRMGVLYRCEYVWRHHVPVAREFGVTEAEIDALRSADLPAGFNPREEALLGLTDDLVERRTIGADAWERWHGVLAQQEIIDLVYLVSQYVLFALANNSFRVALEDPLADVPGLGATHGPEA